MEVKQYCKQFSQGQEADCWILINNTLAFHAKPKVMGVKIFIVLTTRVTKSLVTESLQGVEIPPGSYHWDSVSLSY
jgi:hypothetical protein